MVELFENDVIATQRQSSKGNQLKWESGGQWYKTDFTGYEGLAEYVVSQLLHYSTLKPWEFVDYHTEQIRYKQVIYNGTVSENFLYDDWQIITLERLFKNKYNISLYESIWKISDASQRFDFICRQVKNITGLENFDVYLNKLFTLDAFFLNEDRHMHNVAVLMNSKNEFSLCPIFDNGACLLSDTTMDYPMGADIHTLLKACHSKTISRDFDEQLDVSEAVGENLHFGFTHKDVEQIIDSEKNYPADIKHRVKTILFEQMRKYKYLFK